MAAPAAAHAALKRTPLYDLHRELGAKLIDFGGWEMPVQYAGILEEHRAVRERVGLFDVSHMGELEFTGAGSLAAVQRLTCNDVSRLTDGRIQYSAMLTERGTFVDDVLVYRRAADSYLMVVNASNTPKDFAWASARAAGGVRVEDRSDAYALIAVQGPAAAGLMKRVSAPDPSDLPYYGFRDATAVCGAQALVSRTGYTGEDGFEVYCRPEDAARIFRGLLAGGPRGRRGAVRAGRPRHAAVGSEDGALRQRHRRHDHALGSGSRLDRQDVQGGLRRARGARRPETGRRARGGWPASRWSTAASPATGIPRRRPRETAW